ncbi:MAG TPA: hypothetical protein VHF22_11590, partial [Planctomycetota bacterium]|nr:hypothetical protein [Planctomycetota bacterium]
SPGAVSLDAGAVAGADGSASRSGRFVPVLLPVQKRAKFQPDQYRGTFSPYRGQIHAHTTYSDGATGIPQDAYDMARSNGLDFFAVSDHLEFFPFQPWKWQATKDQANSRTIDGTFVVLWGYEWGTGIANPLGPTLYNHVNVLSDNMVDVLSSTNLDGFYANVAKLGDDPIVKFNHPDSLGAGPHVAGITVSYDNWDGFRYNAAMDRFVRFVRVMPGFSGSIENGYKPLLENGWHMAPGFGEDNHQPTWGQSERRMGVFAASLTREGIKEAMRARRTFTSQDRDAWVRVTAEDPAGELWMGSTVVGPGAVKMKISGGDPSDGLKTLDVVSVGGAVVYTQDLGSVRAFEAEFLADPGQDAYYYVRLTEDDGDLVFSAPIYIDR